MPALGQLSNQREREWLIECAGKPRGWDSDSALPDLFACLNPFDDGSAACAARRPQVARRAPAGAGAGAGEAAERDRRCADRCAASSFPGIRSAGAAPSTPGSTAAAAPVPSPG
eukprot:1178712-Prorocentrum_minimum.AAC.1